MICFCVFSCPVRKSLKKVAKKLQSIHELFFYVMTLWQMFYNIALVFSKVNFFVLRFKQQSIFEILIGHCSIVLLEASLIKDTYFQASLYRHNWAVVVAQMVKRSLPIPEVHGLNPVIGKNLYTLNICLLSTVY